MVDVLYTTEKRCTMCDKQFTVTRVRNKLALLKQDSDFCNHYQDVNPYYYSVWVCPHCGYAAQDAFFEETPAGYGVIKDFLAKRTVNVNFGGHRTRQDAITTYKLGIFFAEMAGTLPSRLAGLYLKLAWIYREAGQAAEEAAMLDKARENYEQAFLKEKTPIGGMTQLTLEYLIGELFRRTNRLSEALNYLAKVVGNPRAKQEKRILEMARDAWTLARDAKKQAGGEQEETAEAQ